MAELTVEPGAYSRVHLKMSGPRALDAAEALEVQRAYWDEGSSADSIARKLGRGQPTIRDCVAFRTYPNLLGRPVVLGGARTYGTVNRAPKGAALALLRRDLAERDRDEGCWMDWPYSRQWADRPSITIPAHPVTGKRWCGPVVKLAHYWETGRWVDNLNHDCQRPECRNPSHVYEGTHRDNVDDSMRLLEFSVRHREASNGNEKD